MSDLARITYGTVPSNTNRLKELISQLSGLVGDAGASINNYANSKPAGHLGKVLLGADPNTQMGLKRGLVNTLSAIPGIQKGGAVTRFAMTNPVVKNALRVVPGLNVLGAGLGVADVVAGDDSLANKVMDTGAMTVGGILGAAGGPIGVAGGVSLGKAGSDALQWLFGDKKTNEQRELELALSLLRGNN